MRTWAYSVAITLQASVAPQGLLIVAPDPVVCFAGARYRQIQRFRVADGGAVVVTDAVVAGRCAAGERWAFHEYYSLVEVISGGRLLVHDAMALRECDGSLAQRLGRFNVLALAVLAGRPLRGDAERLVATSSAQRVTRRADQLMTASALGEDGCILRLAGTSLERVAHTMRALLQFVPDRLGDNPWTRKW